jgi:hypothetical protein
MLARAEPAMPASLCDHCADVSDLLSWSLSRVHLYRLCSSSEQGTNVSGAHNTRTNYFTYLEQDSVIILLWKLRDAVRNKQITHTHTHLGGRSATCWAHLGGSRNETGTIAAHIQVPTRRKQMRLHVGSPLV